jgi:lambda family phage portal protein
MKKTAQNVVTLPVKRQWAAAKQSALNSDWMAYARPSDVDIRYGLSLIRARARELVQNSDHAKGFIRIVRNNVVGAPGFILQSRAVKASGKPDDAARAQVEAEWKAWGRRGNCEISGKFNWRGLQRHVIETAARDGEAFIRIVAPYNNRWGFALQVIDPDAIDITYNGEYQRREVRLGIELDADRRPVAYWINGEPTINQSSYRIGERYRVPAEQIIHIYLPEFCWQTRGVPWMATAAQRLHMIMGTEDAEVTASRASAAKFAAYEAKEFAPPPDDGTANKQLVDPGGNPISSDPGQFSQDIAPGMMEVVPYGYAIKMLDPQHPNAQMPDFLKWGLRSVATGMGVSYNTLGNDAEGVNYTSLRFFLGVERDNWMEAQDWFEGELPDPVYQAWTQLQYMMGTLTPRPGKEAQHSAARWQPRRWDGPDPAKQASADEKELEIGSTTLTQIYARKGIDFDDAVAERISELARIKEAAESAGLTLAEVLPHLAGSNNAPAAAPESNDDD